jgi:predicted GH43/DUF377 family glycosyl hydrolase
LNFDNGKIDPGMRTPFLRSLACLTILVVCSRPAAGQDISSATMDSVYQEVKTPFKYGLVLVPEGDDKKTDSPSVFRHKGKWYMTYIVFDGRGYETWLATSPNLLEWKTLGRILSFGDSTGWDGNQKAAYTALQDPEWGGSYQLNQHDGKYWMSYIGGGDRGYEAGALSIGMAFTPGNPAQAHEWQRLPRPVLGPADADTRWWENKKLYKSHVMADPQRRTGYPYLMYYNANGDTTGNERLRWVERIGMAGSHDLKKWDRLDREPVLQHSRGITGDAVLQKIGDLWVMFYFGAFWEGRENEAFNRFACSRDLVHWTDWTGPDLISSSEAYDDKYAHKSFVLKYQGVVYHFYNAVNRKDQRGIAVATSKDLGKSALGF